jgi:hypothetical protein
LSKRCDWGDLGAKADATKAKAAHSQSKVFRSGRNVRNEEAAQKGNESTSCSDVLTREALGAVETRESRPAGQAKTRRKQGRFRAFPTNIFEKYY